MRVVEWRQAAPVEADLSAYQSAGMAEPRFERFRLAQDLMQVVGVDRGLFDRVESLVFAGAGEHAFPDPLSAPVELLFALAPGQDTAIAAYAEARDQSPFEPLTLPPELAGGVTAAGFVSLLRATAVLNEGSQRWQRRRWVQWTTSYTRVPWQFARTEPVRAVPRLSGEQ